MRRVRGEPAPPLKADGYPVEHPAHCNGERAHLTVCLVQPHALPEVLRPQLLDGGREIGQRLKYPGGEWAAREDHQHDEGDQRQAPQDPACCATAACSFRAQATVHERSSTILSAVLSGCELCEEPRKVQVHQIRKLAKLGQPGADQPPWAALMARKRRKPLIVCQPCHEIIHGRQFAANTA